MEQRVITIAVFNRRTGWSLDPDLVDIVRADAPPTVQVKQAHNFAELIELLPTTDYLVGFPLTAEQITPELNLKWIQMTASVGDNTTALAAARAVSIRLSTASTIRALPVAEHAIACSLALTRGLDTAIRAQAEHRWAAEEIAHQAADLADKRALIIACAPFAEAIVARLAPFGTPITVATLPDEPVAPAPARSIPIDDLEAVLPDTDLLIVAAPRIDATDRRIGRAQLTALAPGAVVVDVSRGGDCFAEARDRCAAAPAHRGRGTGCVRVRAAAADLAAVDDAE